MVAGFGEGAVAVGFAVEATQHQRRVERNRGEGIDRDPHGMVGDGDAAINATPVGKVPGAWRKARLSKSASELMGSASTVG